MRRRSRRKRSGGRGGTAPDALLARSMSLAIGVLDATLAPFGLCMRDDVDVAQRRAERFIDAYREVMA